jgi:hypothetical protein
VEAAEQEAAKTAVPPPSDSGKPSERATVRGMINVWQVTEREGCAVEEESSIRWPPCQSSRLPLSVVPPQEGGTKERRADAGRLLLYPMLPAYLHTYLPHNACFSCGLRAAAWVEAV